MLAGVYLKLIAAAIVVAAVIGGYMYVRGLQTENEELTTKVALFESKIADQNTAIETLKTEGEARLAAAQKDLEAAQVEASKGKTKARIIYKTQPSTPGDDCKSALDLINGTDPVSKATLEAINAMPPAKAASSADPLLNLINGVQK